MFMYSSFHNKSSLVLCIVQPSFYSAVEPIPKVLYWVPVERLWVFSAYWKAVLVSGNFLKTPFQSARRLIWVLCPKPGLRECKNTPAGNKLYWRPKISKIRYFCDSRYLKPHPSLSIGGGFKDFIMCKKRRVTHDVLCKNVSQLGLLHRVVLCRGYKHCGLVWSDG